MGGGPIASKSTSPVVKRRRRERSDNESGSRKVAGRIRIFHAGQLLPIAHSAMLSFEWPYRNRKLPDGIGNLGWHSDAGAGQPGEVKGRRLRKFGGASD
jgi:hypothetical protein